jgi:hypothetical protein
MRLQTGRFRDCDEVLVQIKDPERWDAGGIALRGCDARRVNVSFDAGSWRQRERRPSNRSSVDADGAGHDQTAHRGLRDVDVSVAFEERGDEAIESETCFSAVRACDQALELVHRTGVRP